MLCSVVNIYAFSKLKWISVSRDMSAHICVTLERRTPIAPWDPTNPLPPKDICIYIPRG